MLISHQHRANRQGMEIAIRSCAAVLQRARARGNTKDWGEPPPFWFVRSWETIESTEFRSFSLVYR
jgi:hypothetical protein